MWRFPERDERGELLHERKYGITRYKVTLKVHATVGSVRLRAGEQWHAIEDLEELVMPPADRKALEHLLDG